jgi:hypothetical protein
MSGSDTISAFGRGKGDDDDLRVSVAVLYERLGHVIARLDDMNGKLDRKFSHAEAQTAELERRVEKIEKQVERARGFMIGAACAGGFAGGGAAALIGQIFGG